GSAQGLLPDRGRCNAAGRSDAFSSGAPTTNPGAPCGSPVPGLVFCAGKGTPGLGMVENGFGNRGHRSLAHASPGCPGGARLAGARGTGLSGYGAAAAIIPALAGGWNSRQGGAAPDQPVAADPAGPSGRFLGEFAARRCLRSEQTSSLG